MKQSFKIFGMLALALVLFAGCTPKEGSKNHPPKLMPSDENVTEKKSVDSDEKLSKNQENTGESVRETLETMFDMSRSGKNEEMLVAYRGDDKDRRWSEPYNYEIPEEKLEIEKVAAKLEVILTGMTDIDYTSFIMESESEGVWHVWLTKITYEDGSEEEVAFAFLPVGDAFMLGDID